MKNKTDDVPKELIVLEPHEDRGALGQLHAQAKAANDPKLTRIINKMILRGREYRAKRT